MNLDYQTIQKILLIGLTIHSVVPDVLADSESASTGLDRLRDATTEYQRIESSIPYADLSRAAYGGVKPPGSFREIDRVKGQMGFEVATFKNDSEIIVAFAGTKQLQDFATDIEMLIPTATPSQFKQAADYVEKVKAENPGVQIGLTGHSLGGQIALYVGGINHLDAIAFNAPPPNLKMRLEIVAAQYPDTTPENKPLSLNFSAREGYQSHTGPAADIASAKDLAMRGNYGKTIQVPVQRQGAPSVRNPIQYTQSLLAYHYLDEMTESMRLISKGGPKDYDKITKIWKEIDSRNAQSSNNALPGIDLKNRTTTGGGAPPMELPGVDIERRTTTGGGGPPIPIPGIPPLPTN